MAVDQLYADALAELAQARVEIAGMREQYRRCYRASEFAVRQAEVVLRDAATQCRYHGRDFGFLGWEFGRPRCESCQKPHAVTQALSAVEAWRKAESTSFTQEVA